MVDIGLCELGNTTAIFLLYIYFCSKMLMKMSKKGPEKKMWLVNEVVMAVVKRQVRFQTNRRVQGS